MLFISFSITTSSDVFIAIYYQSSTQKENYRKSVKVDLQVICVFIKANLAIFSVNIY